MQRKVLTPEEIEATLTRLQRAIDWSIGKQDYYVWVCDRHFLIGLEDALGGPGGMRAWWRATAVLLGVSSGGVSDVTPDLPNMSLMFKWWSHNE